jgi:hypothetical protein
MRFFQYFTFVGFVLSFSLQAQNVIKPTKVSTDSFPYVKGNLWYRGFQKDELTTDNLSIYENGNKITFKINNITNDVKPPLNKRVILLIENHFSSSIGNVERNYFKKIIRSAIENAEIAKGDKFILFSFDWFDKSSQSTIIQEIGNYTSNKQEIIDAVVNLKSHNKPRSIDNCNSKITNLYDSTGKISKTVIENNQSSASDISLALKEVLSFASQKKDSLPTSIYLFSDEIDNICSDEITPIIISSRNFNIPINAISFKVKGSERFQKKLRDEICPQTFGNYFINDRNNLSEAIQALTFLLNNQTKQSLGSLYEFNYLSALEKNGATVNLSFEVNKYSAKDNFSLKLPEKNILEKIRSNPITSIIVIIFIIMVIVLIIIVVKKNSKEKEIEKNKILKDQESLRNEINRSDAEKKAIQANLDKLRIDQENRLKAEDAARQKELQENETKKLIKIMLSGGAFPRLLYFYGNQRGTIEMNKPLFMIGRAEGNDFKIDLNTVSKQHAKIVFSEDRTYTLTDLNSSNGTSVNGQKITSIKLKSGDTIELGGIIITFNL